MKLASLFSLQLGWGDDQDDSISALVLQRYRQAADQGLPQACVKMAEGCKDAAEAARWRAAAGV